MLPIKLCRRFLGLFLWREADALLADLQILDSSKFSHHVPNLACRTCSMSRDPANNVNNCREFYNFCVVPFRPLGTQLFTPFNEYGDLYGAYMPLWVKYISHIILICG
jgi:hypothetical protein